MFDSMIVKVGLFVYAVGAIFIISLLWKNAAAPDSIKNFGILVAAILPVAVAVLPYMQEKKVTSHYNLILFYDSERFSALGDQFYGSRYMPMFINSSGKAWQAKDLHEALYVKGLNLIQMGILQSLQIKFWQSWDMEFRKFIGPVSRSERWEGNELARKFNISLDKIKDIFRSNPAIDNLVNLLGDGIAVPPHTTLTAINNSSLRSVVFNNPYVTLAIEVRPSTGVAIQKSIPGVLTIAEDDKKKYFALEYHVTASLTSKHGAMYSPETESYRKWYSNICNILKDFDWETIHQEMKGS